MSAYKKIREQRATARRRILRSYGYTRDEAKKMAYWGDERITKETGIIINPKVYVQPPRGSKPISQYTKKELKRAHIKRNAIQLKHMGLPSEVVHRVKKWAPHKIDTFIVSNWQDAINLKPSSEMEFNKRLRLWKQYSNEKSRRDMPQQLKDYAEAINEDEGLVKDHHYGYAIVYYYFVFGGELASWKERTKRDPHFAEKYIPPVHHFAT